MKRVIFGLLLISLITSCNKNPKLYDLKEFCNYTVECYKSDMKTNAIELRMNKDEVIEMLNSMKLPPELKKHRLSAVEKQDNDGYFSEERLAEQFANIRAHEDKDFWLNCTIDSYEYLDTDKWYGYEMAEPIVILKYGDYTAKFKIGELLKTQDGWKIIQGPTWK